MLQVVKNGKNIDSFLLNIKRPSYYQKIENLSCDMQVQFHIIHMQRTYKGLM